MCNTNTIHPFEKAGLGLAPFRYVGMVEQEMSYGERVIGSVGGVPITTRAGGTCDFCGHAIVDMYRVESSDGKRFKVGCDCIRKVGSVDSKMVKSMEIDRRAAKLENEKARIKTAFGLLQNSDACRKLASQPHPSIPDKNFLSYVNWMSKNAGHSGKLRVTKDVERLMITADPA